MTTDYFNFFIMLLSKSFSKEIINIVKNGGVGIIPTDTIYGIIANATNKKSVEKIYKIKNRDTHKPFIILISSIKDLNIFQIALTKKEKLVLNKYWPGEISFILKCKSKKWSYLHRNMYSLAFRMPKNKDLVTFIKSVKSPLVAPSANNQGQNPATSIKKAIQYFGDKVDFYVDLGYLKSKPSTIAKLENSSIDIIRQGAVKVRP